MTFQTGKINYKVRSPLKSDKYVYRKSEEDQDDACVQQHRLSTAHYMEPGGRQRPPNPHGQNKEVYMWSRQSDMAAIVGEASGGRSQKRYGCRSLQGGAALDIIAAR